MNVPTIAKLAHSALRQLVDARRECERFDLAGFGQLSIDRVRALEKCIHVAEHNVRELLTLLEQRHVTITLDPPVYERPHVELICKHPSGADLEELRKLVAPKDGGDAA